MSTELRHPEWNLRVSEDPQSSAMCEIGYHLVPPGEPRLSSFIGTSGQSSFCFDCLKQAYDTVAAYKKKRVPSDGKLRVEATA